MNALRLADLLGALSMVADLGFALPPQSAMRTCLIATSLGRRIGLTDDEVRDCFYTALLMHVGCTSLAHETVAAFGDDLAFNRAAAMTNLADPDDIGATFIPELTRGMSDAARARVTEFTFTQGQAWGRRADTGSCEVARDTARRVGLPESTQAALHHIFEAWQGGWVPEGTGGDAIPIAARIVRASGDAALFDHLGGVDAAVAALRARAGTVLDPGVVDAFAHSAPEILGEVNRGDPRELILDAEPGPVVERSGTGLREVAEAFGDLADLKTPFLHGHAADVARLATGAARRLELDAADVERIEIGALLHDVGRVGVSTAIWEKPDPLTRTEWEQVRMHGYHSERILATSPSLESVATIAGMHHERLDGSGYHRCSSGVAVPMAARLLAAADAFSAMTQARPFRDALALDDAAARLTADARAGRLDLDAVGAVLAEAGQDVKAPRAARPAGLSEREVEVLRLVADGCSNAQVAVALFISRRTAEHHVQHIYAKIGVSTRPAAALFALRHGLLGPNR